MGRTYIGRFTGECHKCGARGGYLYEVREVIFRLRHGQHRDGARECSFFRRVKASEVIRSGGD